ncbi:MAG: DUF3048 domain-containing protein [bacterium]|nr:DUF3048 domain-containing protein [bacterium]
MSKIGDKLKDWLWALKKNKKAQIMIAVAFGLIIVLIILYFVLQSINSKNDANNIANNNLNSENGLTAEITGQAARKIDGIETAAIDSNLYPTAIIVENLETIRPQSGLSQANLVYEALAEGGITRFMAVYATAEDIELIGPVRSARHYFVDWAEEYGGMFAHIGGSPQALGILGTTDYMTDLNQFGYPQYYFRDENLYAPHNLFSTSELQTFAIRDLGLSDESGDFESYLFKEESEVNSELAEASDITVEFSTSAYEAKWQYDESSNSYLRSNGGEPHIDKNNDEQLVAKNIVIQKVETQLLESDTGRIDIVTMGGGDALLFQDGTVQEGRWIKSERGDRTKFIDLDDNEFEFNPGTTWIEVVPIEKEVTY